MPSGSSIPASSRKRHAALAAWLAGLGVAGAGVFIAPAAAAELPESARREITELMARIEQSACEFNRSGTWYSGAQARQHLQRKYTYLAERGKLATAEDFVSMAASRSSITGEPYLIRCGSAAPVPSSAWLDAELRRLRSSNTAPR